MTPESRVKASVVKLLKQYEVYYFFPATHGFGRSGVPDIVCCLEGNFLAIECKAGDNKPTALQQRELQRIANAGGDTFLINEENLHTLESYLLGEDDDRC